VVCRGEVCERAAYNQGFIRLRQPARSDRGGAANANLQRDIDVFISNAYAQTAASTDATGGLMGMLPLVLMFVVLYFVMIRPQMKRQKEHKAMIEALAKGDEIITAGGLLGKVSKMGESYLSVEISEGVEIQVQRSAVVQVLPKGTLK
jgi:preprotein translocase subunit YajC